VTDTTDPWAGVPASRKWTDVVRVCFGARGRAPSQIPRGARASPNGRAGVPASREYTDVQGAYFGARGCGKGRVGVLADRKYAVTVQVV
jgi:hypothetical protein